MGIVLTEKAAGEIRRILSEQNAEPTTVLKVGAMGGGCSGYQYSLNLDTNCDEAMFEITDQHGIRVAVDRRANLVLEGTKVDFYDGLEKRGFTFENPNATKSCGCGSSFSV
jgi:iron-sulfur cluster assembly protein